MYYYISFLRPPPQQHSLSSALTITPQIANDLRTEQFPDDQDIYYSWSPVSNTHDTSADASPYPISRPQKLTTWRESNAYRELKVPCPQGLREGQQYRLMLSTQNKVLAHMIDLSATVEIPFPVFSMPITFSSRTRPNAAKQERIERVYRLPSGPGAHVHLTLIEQTSFDLDKKIWDSGLGLSSWLSDLVYSPSGSPGDLALSKEVRDKISNTKCQIIELGAGTGIVSLVLGAIRSDVVGVEASGGIVTTDLQSAMPLLQHNVSINAHIFSSQKTRPQPVVLDWDEAQLPPDATGVERGFDLIVMADVAYNTASFPSLIRTIDQLLRLSDSADGRGEPLVLLGYKERDAAERELWDMTRAIGLELHKLGEKPGAGGLPVEIWAGRRQVPSPST